MHRILAILGHWVHGLAFALWFGGILAIGGLAAPAAFHVNRQFAGVVVTDTFGKLNTVSFVCAALMLAATWAEWRVRSDQARRWLFIRAVLTASALALGLYLGARLFPTMIHLRALDRMADFDQLHRVSREITGVQLWLLAAGSLITAYLALPRKAGVRGEGSGVSSKSSALTPDPSPLAPGATRP